MSPKACKLTCSSCIGVVSCHPRHLEYSFAWMRLNMHRGYHRTAVICTQSSLSQASSSCSCRQPERQIRTRNAQLVIPAVCPEATSAQVSRPVPAPTIVPATAVASYESGLHFRGSRRQKPLVALYEFVLRNLATAPEGCGVFQMLVAVDNVWIARARRGLVRSDLCCNDSAF